MEKLINEIIVLTSFLEDNYPELYRFLDETPLNMSGSSSKSPTVSDLEDYLNTLKEQLNSIQIRNKRQ